MDEHQIQIRTMPELDATDLTVTDDDERRIAERAIAALWLAMTRDGVAPGEGQHFLQDRLSQPGQVVADLHQGQRPGDFRSGDPQPMRQLEMPQCLHLLLEVILGNAHQPFAQFSRQFRRQRLYRRPALSSSSSNSGKRAICSAIHGLAAQSSSKRCSAPGFSVSRTR